MTSNKIPCKGNTNMNKGYKMKNEEIKINKEITNNKIE